MMTLPNKNSYFAMHKLIESENKDVEEGRKALMKWKKREEGSEGGQAELDKWMRKKRRLTEELKAEIERSDEGDVVELRDDMKEQGTYVSDVTAFKMSKFALNVAKGSE